MKASTGFEVALRLATVCVGIIPQLLAILFFASSVRPSLLLMSLVAIGAMATLAFMPNTRRRNLIGLVASIILLMELAWEIFDSASGGAEPALSSIGGLLLAVLWLAWFIWKAGRAGIEKKVTGRDGGNP
jgi:hypothetical protein